MYGYPVSHGYIEGYWYKEIFSQLFWQVSTMAGKQGCN
jgi:hypothetical protein